MAKRTIKLSIDAALHKRVTKVFEERGIKLETFLTIHLIAACNARVKSKMALADRMPFGKYAGAKIEDIVRGDLNYILYLIGNNAKFHDDVLALVSELNPS